MRIVKPSFEILDNIDGEAILRKIERCGRIAYKSEPKKEKPRKDAEGRELFTSRPKMMTPNTAKSAEEFVKRLICLGHESVLEHVSISVLIVCDRGISHEIVRHRIASYTQESTRFCNYADGKFGSELTFVAPYFWEDERYGNKEEYEAWKSAMAVAENSYLKLVCDYGASPQEARSVLPNSLKTEIVVTMNLREWRHFFYLRTAKDAHPQMREIAVPLLCEFKRRIPVVFDSIVGVSK